ncbi:MtrB/PioB family decaheme-associated outer membrane protein [Aquabacterium sp.]|uniref:MtrB/PioB family decaheme-associated outer membrane protein n=1 Tax=Aquabacterium sp. TaxID=1872578 RepID=UPI0037838C07
MNAAHGTNHALRATVIAAQACLATLVALPPAHAADAVDPALAALVQPTSTVELGVGHVSDGDFKANEYTGLKKKGAYAIGNFDLRGGGSYDSDDASRWKLLGRNLGTEARELYGEYSLQGRFRISLGYDELLRNRSDSYQTPLLGAGTNVLSLPSNWIVPVVPRVSSTAANARGLLPAVTDSSALVNGVLTAPTDAQRSVAAALQAADLPAFQQVDLHTRRARYDLAASYLIDRQWEFNASFRHEDKTGLKPMGTVSRATGGDISTIIPDLIDQTTEQLNLGLQFRSDKVSVQLGYYGSVFTNHVPSMTWSNWALPGNSQTMSTAPSNQFHQLNLTATASFSPTTRLVANASYGRGTQNESFLTAAYTPLVPVASLDGLVVTRAANLKFSSRPIKDLDLHAAYKFDERDNRSAVHTYGFYDAGEPKASAASVFQAYFPGVSLGANTNLNANRPYSRRVNQLDLGADYRLSRGQALKAELESQQIDRYCSGSWIDCVDAHTTKENTLRLEWRLSGWHTLNARVGLAHGERTVNYNEDAWLALVPAATLSPTGAPNGATAYGTLQLLGLTGYGPVSGLNPLPTAGSAAAFFFANNNALANALYGNQNRISELPGMRRYNMADRTRDKARAGLEWQPDEKLSLQATLDLNQDEYRHSVYGLQRARSQALNLDGSYALSENTSLNAFFTHEEQTSHSAGNTYTANSTAANVSGFTAILNGCFATIALRNASNKVDPCLDWSAEMRDRVDTLGASFTQRGLMGDRLELNGSLSFSRARSSNDVAGGNYANNPLAVTGAAAGTVAAYYIAAAPLPLVKTQTTELQFGARFAIDKQQALRVGYRYQHMRSSDWAYDGLQFGGLSGVLPTNETAPSYTVHTVGLSWLYSFR